MLSEDFGYLRGVGPGQTISLPHNQVPSICGGMRQRRVIDAAIFSDSRYGRDLEIRFDLGPGGTNSLAINVGGCVLATASPDHEIFFSDTIERYSWLTRYVA